MKEKKSHEKLDIAKLLSWVAEHLPKDIQCEIRAELLNETGSKNSI